MRLRQSGTIPHNRFATLIVNEASNFLAGNGYQQNAYFKVVNENTNNAPNDKQIVVNGQIQLILEQKKVPSILKRNSNVVTKPPSIVIPAECTKGGKIAISPLSQTIFNDVKDHQIKVGMRNHFIRRDYLE